MDEVKEENKVSFKEKWINRIKNFTWQDWGLVIIILVLLAIQLSIFSAFQHIPGPIYGGDLYRERGYTEHILRGNMPWSDPLFLNEINYFPWLAHLLASALILITKLSAQTVLIYFPTILLILTGIFLYLLGQKIFRNKTYALILPLIYLSRIFIESKHTEGSARVLSILFLLFWFQSQENKRIKDFVYIGVVLGLISLLHGSIFINAMIFFMSLLLFEVVEKIKKNNFEIKEFIKKYALTSIILFSLSMLFFGPLIAKYHLQTLNNSYAYAIIDLKALGTFWSLKQALNVFFNFSSPITMVLGLVSFLGLILVLLNMKKNNYRFVIYLFFGTIIASAHYLITAPLFNKWMEPGHMLSLMIIPSSIFFVFGIKMISIGLKKITKRHLLISLFIATIIICSSFSVSIKDFNNSRWTQYGKSMDPHTRAILDFGDWIKQNTNKDDVFLANDETSFALNAVSGAKVVMSRRVHASYFADVDKKYADGMVMLYSGDEETVKNLLKQYNVKYLYLDQYLLNYPMITGLKHQEYLNKNKINFTVANVRLDPSTSYAPTFDSLVVPPQNLMILNLFYPVKEVLADGNGIGVLYKVKNNLD